MNSFSYELCFLCVWRTDMKKELTRTCYKFFNNLSNPTRLAVMEKLMENPMSVNDLAAALNQEQSMISHNLKPLLRCNFVFTKRQGKKHVYSANHETLGALFSVIQCHAEKFCPTGGKCLIEEKQDGS